MIKTTLYTLLGQIDSGELGIPKVSADDTTWAAIVSGVFIAIGGAAVLYLLLAALRYVTSGGDSGAIQQAKNAILYAAIGIVVAVSGFLIVQFVIGRLG